MDIHWFDRLDSTQTYLVEAIRTGALKAPVCVGARTQTAGKGSRGNDWIGERGNLFVSVALERSILPGDLKLESSSIYLAFLMKEILALYGSAVWLKWPNDFYLEEVKIGGVITNLVSDVLICGIGLNLAKAPDGFGEIDIEIGYEELTVAYCKVFEKLPEWKQIFSKFQLEFVKSRAYFTHHNHETFSLEKALLLEDGSLECEGQRIYSLR